MKTPNELADYIMGGRCVHPAAALRRGGQVVSFDTSGNKIEAADDCGVMLIRASYRDMIVEALRKLEGK